MKKKLDTTKKIKMSDFELGRIMLCTEIFKKMDKDTETLEKMGIMLDVLTDEMKTFVEKFKNVQ